MSDLVDTFLEVRLHDEESFLKIKETLGRIGVVSKTENILFQSCHILHKKGRYYIVHFKELHALDGKETNFSREDLGRRNRIASLLQDWGLLKVTEPVKLEPMINLTKIKIVKFQEKKDWKFVQKYTLGKYRNES